MLAVVHSSLVRRILEIRKHLIPLSDNHHMVLIKEWKNMATNNMEKNRHGDDYIEG